MNKRIIVILTVCFLLTPISIAYADVLILGPLDAIFGLLILILPFAMIVGLIAGTAVMIRDIWRRAKDKKGKNQ